MAQSEEVRRWLAMYDREHEMTMELLRERAERRRSQGTTGTTTTSPGEKKQD